MRCESLDGVDEVRARALPGFHLRIALCFQRPDSCALSVCPVKIEATLSFFRPRAGIDLFGCGVEEVREEAEHDDRDGP